jgi:hypothetical protein
VEQNSFLARGLLAITMFNFIAPVSAARSSDAAVPDWENAAGGKMEFEVASIRLSKPGTYTPPNFTLDSWDTYGSDADPHGRLAAIIH